MSEWDLHAGADPGMAVIIAGKSKRTHVWRPQRALWRALCFWRFNVLKSDSAQASLGIKEKCRKTNDLRRGGSGKKTALLSAFFPFYARSEWGQAERAKSFCELTQKWNSTLKRDFICSLESSFDF